MSDATDDPDKPDPAFEAIRARMVRFFVINMVFLFAALMVVVGALVYKAMKKPANSAASPVLPADPAKATTLPIPAGAKLLGSAATADRVSLDVEFGDGSREIRVHDAATGVLVGRYRIAFE
ncbi:MAG: fimbrial protein [Phyllobacteriaceae bacterium]|nr:fimbrial protein [Phyllobacteriaceae bacterium]